MRPVGEDVQRPVARDVFHRQRPLLERLRQFLVDERSGPRNLDSGLSEISIVFQAAVPKLVASKYTTSGVGRPSEL